jgi:hypothetical protein
MKHAVNITPHPFRCDFEASCPAVFETNADTYYIVGKKLGNDVPELRGKVGDDEMAVEISAALLKAALASSSDQCEDPRRAS